jgi:hypothetical protein
MSKLPMANFKTMDKMLRRLGFEAVRQKGSHVFRGMQTAGQLPFPTTVIGILLDRSCVKFCGKFLSHLMSSRNCLNRISTRNQAPHTLRRFSS